MSNYISSKIHIDGYVEVESCSGVTKNISLEDYISIVQRILGDSDTQGTQVSKVLPDNIHSITEDSSTVIVCIYKKETCRDITHTTWGTHTIAAPNVLLRIVLNKVVGEINAFSIGEINWYTSDLPRSSLPNVFPPGSIESERIWCLPMPNMFNSCKMCLGGNSIPPIIYGDWTVLNSLIEDTLWGSTFNNDLSIRGLKDNVGISNWLTILRTEHSEGRSFPYHLLR
tara:strand:- start:236 stop:916 length:681 start_codon:yes stop_codon:yes gene_type:complete